MNWTLYWQILAATGASFGVGGFLRILMLEDRVSQLADRVRELERAKARG